MGQIRDKILRLKQNINSVGLSLPMDYVNLDFIERMEIEAVSNPVFREVLGEIDKYVNKVGRKIEDYKSIIKIKEIYSEAYIFSKLQPLVQIEKVPTVKKAKGKKTPDFKIQFNDKNFFVEMKSLDMTDGPLKHKEIMEQSLGAKIAAEEEIRKGRRVGFGEQVIHPYFRPLKDCDPWSVRLVIELLIDKISQNVKKDQFLSGDTILLADLSNYLPIMAEPSDAILEFYHDGMGSHASGALWNVAFGKTGDQILKPAEFEGANNLDGELQKTGILIKYPYIQGLIFHVKEDFYSLAEIKNNNSHVRDLIKHVSTNYKFKSIKP